MNPIVVRVNQGTEINVLGDNQQIKLTGNETNGQLTVIIQELPAGIFVPKHVHQFEDENFQVMEGEVEFEIGNDTVTLKSGDMIYLPKNQPHAIRNSGSVTAKVRLNIVPAGLEEMFKELNDLPSGEPDLQKVTEICGKYGVSFV